MSVILSNRLYLPYSPQLAEKVKEELTYTIPARRRGARPTVFKDFFKIRNTISVPIGRQDFIPEGAEIIDKRISIPVDIPDILYTLRPSQQEAVNLINDNYVINAIPGYGKTVTALAIVSKLKQKTLIIVHTVALRDQWIREVQKILGIEPGIIGSGKYETDKDIVIANIQSLYKHSDDLKSKFGMVVTDECHHAPARTFKEVLDKLKSRYKLGLSGTLIRKDGRHVYMLDYITPFDIYVPQEENILKPEIVIFPTDFPISDSGLIPWANKITALTSIPNYNIIIKRIAEAEAKKGHKVLCVSDRIQFLEALGEGIANSLVVTGMYKERSDLERRLSDDIDIIFGSISIFKEGISLNALSCLILATPINNDAMLTQLIGRIQRKHEGKLNPIVIDLQYKGKTAKRQQASRLNLYYSKEYKIHTLNND